MVRRTKQTTRISWPPLLGFFSPSFPSWSLLFWWLEIGLPVREINRRIRAACFNLYLFFCSIKDLIVTAHILYGWDPSYSMEWTAPRTWTNSLKRLLPKICGSLIFLKHSVVCQYECGLLVWFATRSSISSVTASNGSGARRHLSELQHYKEWWHVWLDLKLCAGFVGAESRLYNVHTHFFWSNSSHSVGSLSGCQGGLTKMEPASGIDRGFW